MNRPLVTGLLMYLSFSFFPAQAQAWTGIDGDEVPPHPVWLTLPVTYTLNSQGSVDLGGFSATETVILASFASWSAPECTDWATSYGGSTTRRPGSDGYNVMAWTESGWGYESYAIGVTTVSFYSSERIAEADIDFNGQYFTWSTSGGSGSTVDTQSIATHEMGHFLGLGHPTSCSEGQTMCATYSGGTGARTLAPDDINGVCTIYPSGSGGCVTDSDCSAGEHCDGGICVPDTTAGEPCDPCSSHEDCGSTYDFCLSGFPDGGAYCGAQCTTDTNCPTGFSCMEVSGSTVFQCIPDSMDCSSTPPECTTDSDCPTGEICDGGECVPDTTTDCATDADCPAGYVCDGGTCVPDTTPDCYTDADCPPGTVCDGGTCVTDPSPHLPMCSVCEDHEDCGGPSDLCMGGFVDGTTRCGVACENVGGDCGEGNVCFDFPDLPDQCVPASMDCTPDCTTDAECPPGEHCQGGYCTNFCDPRDGTSCPEGYYCRFTSCTTGVCSEAPEGPGPLALGEPCISDLDCADLWCRDMGSGSYCTTMCNFVSGGLCPAPMTCQPAQGGLCGYCSCSAGRLGDACEADSDCQAGTCGEEWGVAICIQDCTDPGLGCPGGFACTPVGDGTRSLCIPDRKGMGEPCTTSEECFDSICTSYSGRTFCSRQCDTLGCTCPGGFDCVATADGATHICVASSSVNSGCGCEMVGGDRVHPPGWVLVLLSALVMMFIVCWRSRKFG